MAFGILYITTAFFFVAVMSALGKAASGLPASGLAFFQNFIALILFLPFFVRGGLQPLKTTRLRLHLVRTAGGLLSQVLMFVAVREMPLVDAVLLTNSTPLIMPLLAWIWFKEKIPARVGLSLSIGFIGIIIILKPNSTFLLHPASLIAISSAVVSGIGLLAVNQLSKTEPSSRILFYYFAFSTLFTLPFAVRTFGPLSQTNLLCLAGIGTCMAAAQGLIILAYRHAPAVTLAPFNYSVVIFSGLLGWIVWGHAPDSLSLIGVLLVVASGISIAMTGNVHFAAHFGWLGHLHISGLWRFWQKVDTEH